MFNIMYDYINHNYWIKKYMFGDIDMSKSGQKNEENKRQHLQMIQDVISRMASNSFIVKGWAITAFGAMFAFYLQNKNYYILILVLILAIMFWWHDAYYLWLERRYRDLYNNCQANELCDFSLKFNANSKEKVHHVLLRPILFWTYGIISIGTIFLLFIFFDSNFFNFSFDCWQIFIPTIISIVLLAAYFYQNKKG